MNSTGLINFNSVFKKMTKFSYFKGINLMRNYFYGSNDRFHA